MLRNGLNFFLFILKLYVGRENNEILQALKEAD